MLPNDPAPQSSSSSGTRGRRSGRARDRAGDELRPATGRDPGAADGRARRRSARGPSILAIAVAVVALLAGSALFMSGVLVGERLDAQPGTPTSRADQFQPFWDTYHAIEDRYAGGDVDQQALIRGAIRGMVESLDDPYSAYLTPEEYQSGLQDLSGQFEGIGAEIGTRSATGQTSPTARRSAPTASSSSSRRSMARRPRRPGLVAGDAILKIDGAGLDGLTRRRGPEQGPRQEGHDRRPDDRARQRRPVRRARSSATSSSRRRSSRRTSRTARSATSTSTASRTTPRASSTTR